MALYHYTSKPAYDIIIRTGSIKFCKDRVEKFFEKLQAGEFDKLLQFDSNFGAGLYLTDLDPSECNLKIQTHCWQTVNAHELQKVEYYIQIDPLECVLRDCREHVYLIPRAAGQEVKFVKHGKVPPCSDGPCPSCKRGLAK
jgi:hypothetical protein